MACTKATFQSKKHARLVGKQKRGAAGNPLFPYRCPECGLWHLTSKGKKPWAKPPTGGPNKLRSRHRASTREEAERLAEMLRRQATKED